MDNKAKIRSMLDECGVSYEWLEHDRVFTMDDCAPIGEALGARHCKNLVLTNRQKSAFYLLLTDDKPFRTAVFSKAMGVSRLSFVPGEMLLELLGVEPGSASPLALINDSARRVNLAIDQSVLKWDRICLHPGDSTASVAMPLGDMLKIITGYMGRGYTPVEL